jgi:hypothetical protein
MFAWNGIFELDVARNILRGCIHGSFPPEIRLQYGIFFCA